MLFILLFSISFSFYLSFFYFFLINFSLYVSLLNLYFVFSPRLSSSSKCYNNQRSFFPFVELPIILRCTILENVNRLTRFLLWICFCRVNSLYCPGSMRLTVKYQHFKMLCLKTSQTILQEPLRKIPLRTLLWKNKK